MNIIKISDAAKAVGGSFTAEGEFENVYTDSRKTVKNGLFVAIEGDNFDGHDFCKKAVEKGAVAVLCRKKVDVNVPVIYVEDTKKALLDLAEYYRNSFDVPVVGLTGSVGKTTTKDMIALVVSAKYNTLKTQGNLNNDIGMPLTIFSMKPSCEAAVIEMGMNHFGEIATLTKVSQPTVGVITNIGSSHIENLGSRENILKAKLEILQGMKVGSPLILNGDNDLLSTVRTDKYKIVFFGIDNPICKVRAKKIIQQDGKTVFDAVVYGETVKTVIPCIGIHNVYNALAAFAVGNELGISAQMCANALSDYSPSGMRQNIVYAEDITFIEDCYNASPDSVKASLSTLSTVKADRRIAVLGDMLELGSVSEKAHYDSGVLCFEKGVDILYTYGEKSVITANAAKAKGLKCVKAFSDKKELSEDLASVLKPNDAVVFKASHSMRLEEVISLIYEKLGIR